LPLPGLLRQVSYPDIRYYSSRYETIQLSLEELSESHRTAVICHDSEYPWRNIAATFGAVHVVVLPRAPLLANRFSAAHSEEVPYAFLNVRREEFEKDGDEILLPPVDLVAWPYSVHSAENQARLEQDGFQGHYVLYLRKVSPGERFKVGAYKFRVRSGLAKQY
jgi:hypothetical protein